MCISLSASLVGSADFIVHMHVQASFMHKINTEQAQSITHTCHGARLVHYQ